jgi:glycosyltransferase involved in cell wall biosynthesis
MDPDLSVIIPAYNEAERITPTLQRVNDYLRASSFSSEILVVLDEPTDNTLGVLREVSGRSSKSEDLGPPTKLRKRLHG